jgi:hypothetical protein
MIVAVRLDTFPKAQETKVFYIGTNDPAELTEIRRHILGNFKDLPIEGEYLHRVAFDIGKNTARTPSWRSGISVLTGYQNCSAPKAASTLLPGGCAFSRTI